MRSLLRRPISSNARSIGGGLLVSALVMACSSGNSDRLEQTVNAQNLSPCLHAPSTRTDHDQKLVEVWQSILCEEGRWSNAQSCTEVPPAASLPEGASRRVCLDEFDDAWAACGRASTVTVEDSIRASLARMGGTLVRVTNAAGRETRHREYIMKVKSGSVVVRDRTVPVDLPAEECKRLVSGAMECTYRTIYGPPLSTEPVLEPHDPNFNCFGYAVGILMEGEFQWVSDVTGLLSSASASRQLQADFDGDAPNYEPLDGLVAFLRSAKSGELITFHPSPTAAPLHAMTAIEDTEAPNAPVRWLAGKEGIDGIRWLELGELDGWRARFELSLLVTNFGEHVRISTFDGN
jgi:hypothetical protein